METCVKSISFFMPAVERKELAVCAAVAAAPRSGKWMSDVKGGPTAVKGGPVGCVVVSMDANISDGDF